MHPAPPPHTAFSRFDVFETCPSHIPFCLLVRVDNVSCVETSSHVPSTDGCVFAVAGPSSASY